MILDEWANQWGISHNAINDLRARLGVVPTINATNATLSEAFIQSSIRLNAAKHGIYLWRNNVGVAFTKTGRPIRYGLANESKKQNSLIKSTDLIGIKPIKITSAMIGHTIGQFLAIEAKHAQWTYSGTPKEQAQLRYIKLVVSLGGDAYFTNQTGSFFND